jgi:TetR/AcrR family transcriptional regulator, fatty acid biosynthesis regulator
MTNRRSSTRLESKELTRQALIRAALKLLSQNSFDSLSLREVTREAGITPTAFYRHFDDMEELGLVLVEESLQSLGAMLKDARSQAPFDGDTIKRSLAVVVLHMHNHTAHFRFIARERYGGVRRLRRAINRELQLFADELAIDLVAMPGVDKWSTEDRRMLAGVITETIIRMVAELLEVGPDEEQMIVERTKRQLRLISLGVPAWDGALGTTATWVGDQR